MQLLIAILKIGLNMTVITINVKSSCYIAEREKELYRLVRRVGLTCLRLESLLKIAVFALILSVHVKH